MLSSNYTIAPSLQDYFVDKDSGLPLANGVVYFYENEAPTVPRPVYELTLVGGVYHYVQLPNPMTLSAVGTFVDGSGNDIVPYYQVINPTTGAVQLYYIAVYNSGGVLQFTRIAWPNFIDNDVLADQNITNHVANGQFILHNNQQYLTPLSGAQVQTSLNYGTGIGTLNIWEIAQGGWTFEKNSGSTSVDAISFPRIGAATQTPTGNPRYVCQIATTVAGTDATKDICVKFPNVNEFASTTQQYNLYFEAQAINAPIANVQIIVRKYFGAGGSPGTETSIGTVTLGTAWLQYNTAITFGVNANMTIGTGDDDFVQIVIRLPPTGVQTAQFANFALTINNAALSTFPSETYAEQYDESTVGYLPTPVPSDGSAYYLPIVYTPTGTAFDTSYIGRIYASPYATAASTELICDGTSYWSGGYSAIGIPYSRLATAYYNSSTHHELYGTGYQFLETYASTSNTALLFLQQNNFGTNTFPADASSIPSKTGFAFAAVMSGFASLNQEAFMYAASTILVRTNALYNGTAPADVSTTFTIAIVEGVVSATSLVYTIQTVAGSAIPASSYFTFNNEASNYYVWFKVNGAGADPAPGGTGIEVDILSTWTAAEVAQILLSVMQASQVSTITCVAATTPIPAGAYFTFKTNANANAYYAWYQVGGVGSDPLVASSTGIKIAIGSSDSAATVASKTLAALNQAYVGTPDLRGFFLRGYDSTSNFNQDASTRLSKVAGIFGNAINTYELDNVMAHQHPPLAPDTTFLGNQAPAGNSINAGGGNRHDVNFTGYFGGVETRPYNTVINWVVRY